MKIVNKKIWSMNSVREMCIRNNLYTRGDNEDYETMLYAVANTEPTDEIIYNIAVNINHHSERQTITNVMFMLANEAITICYTVYDDNGLEIE